MTTDESNTFPVASYDDDISYSLMLSIIHKFKRHETISSVSQEAAIAFLNALPRAAPLPKVAIDTDGALMLAWTLASGARTIVIIDGWTIHCVSRAGTDMAEYINDIPFDGAMPKVIRDLLLG